MRERLEGLYKEEIRPKLQREFGLANILAVPRIKKVMVSSGIGRFKDDPKLIESVANDIKLITGQVAKFTRSRKAISAFKLKAGDVVGLAVTLRGSRMWSFLDKLINVVLPRLRDFRGIDPASFDECGNLSLGFPEQTVFPEIDPNKIDRIKGLGVTIETSAGNSQRGKVLLSSLGFPFKRSVDG